MTVKKPIPCSFFDIPGMQQWLDEMALQGLFLQDFTRQMDKAVFEVGEPKPMRYRLDPVGKSKKADLAREAPYKEAGWVFAAYIPGAFYVFSCDDPEAPELYSDPQSLAVALDGTIKRQIMKQTVSSLFPFLLIGLFLCFNWKSYWKDILLWEHPRSLFTLVLAAVLLPVLLLLVPLGLHRLLSIRRTLELGLPLKAKRRWNRPRWIVLYLLFVLPLSVLPYLLFHDYAPEICALEEAELAHSWPTAVQLEGTGPCPLETEPEADGYVITNSSWFVPVQEFVSIDWRRTDVPGPVPGETISHSHPYTLYMSVQYDRARSPKTAQHVYQLRRGSQAEYLEDAQSYNNPYRITDLQPLEALDCPGLDRLEAAHFRRQGQDSWAITLLRGTEVLVVDYTGCAPPQSCLPLFLEALNQTIP